MYVAIKSNYYVSVHINACEKMLFGVLLFIFPEVFVGLNLQNVLAFSNSATLKLKAQMDFICSHNICISMLLTFIETRTVQKSNIKQEEYRLQVRKLEVNANVSC